MTSGGGVFLDSHSDPGIESECCVSLDGLQQHSVLCASRVSQDETIEKCV